MKLKSLSILVLLVALTFPVSACSNDNDIVGKWQYCGRDSHSAEVVTNNPKISAAIEKQLLKSYGNIVSIVDAIEFKPDGTFIDYTNDIDGTYTIKDGVITTFNGNNSEDKGFSTPYRVDGNKLSFIPSDWKSDYTNADETINPESYRVKDLFKNYKSELGDLTLADFTSITRAEVTTTFTRK